MQHGRPGKGGWEEDRFRYAGGRQARDEQPYLTGFGFINAMSQPLMQNNGSGQGVTSFTNSHLGRTSNANKIDDQHQYPTA